MGHWSFSSIDDTFIDVNWYEPLGFENEWLFFLVPPPLLWLIGELFVEELLESADCGEVGTSWLFLIEGDIVTDFRCV